MACTITWTPKWESTDERIAPHISPMLERPALPAAKSAAADRAARRRLSLFFLHLRGKRAPACTAVRRDPGRTKGQNQETRAGNACFTGGNGRDRRKRKADIQASLWVMKRRKSCRKRFEMICFRKRRNPEKPRGRKGGAGPSRARGHKKKKTNRSRHIFCFWVKADPKRRTFDVRFFRNKRNLPQHKRSTSALCMKRKSVGVEHASSTLNVAPMNRYS